MKLLEFISKSLIIIFLESEKKLLELHQLYWQLHRPPESLYLLMRQLRLYLVQIAVFLRPDVSDSYIIGHHRHNEIWKQNEKMQRSVNYFLLKVWNFWLKALKRVNRYLLGIRMIINGMVSCAECIYLKQIFLFSMKNKRSLLTVVENFYL